MSRKKQVRIKSLFIVTVLSVVLGLANYSGIALLTEEPETFRFIFATDIHLKPEKHSVDMFNQAIAHINNMKPKPHFVITGGDLIENSYALDFDSTDKLYNLYQNTCKKFDMPVHDIIGNNDLFLRSKKSGEDSSHPEYGKGMFRKRLGSGTTYRSFDYGRWHFILLDSIGRTEEGSLRGYIDDEQFIWLADILAKIGKESPVCIALHIPLVSMFSQIHVGTLVAPAKFAIVNNGTRVINELLSKYNVKLVLQGHLHILEELKYKNTTYITGGSLSSARKFQHLEHPEGFIVVDVKGNEFSWKYETYKSIPKKKEGEAKQNNARRSLMIFKQNGRQNLVKTMIKKEKQ